MPQARTMIVRMDAACPRHGRPRACRKPVRRSLEGMLQARSMSSGMPSANSTEDDAPLWRKPPAGGYRGAIPFSSRLVRRILLRYRHAFALSADAASRSSQNTFFMTSRFSCVLATMWISFSSSIYDTPPARLTRSSPGIQSQG